MLIRDGKDMTRENPNSEGGVHLYFLFSLFTQDVHHQ